MEQLNLSDLSFDTGNDEIFDVFTQKGAGTTEPTKEIKNPISEEENKIPENVAKGEDKTSQDDKLPKSNEGSADSSSPSNDTEKLYSSLAAEFKAKGILSGLDLDKDKISSMEDINKAINREIDSRLSARNKAIEDAIKAGLPAEEVSNQLESISRLKEITDDYVSSDGNEEFRVNVIAQDLINKGFSKEKALAKAQRSVDSGDDIEDAMDALREIILSEEAKLNESIASKQDDEKDALTKVKNYVDKEEEIIPGIKFTTTQKQELYDQITTDLGDKENAFIQAQKKDPLGSRVKLEALFYVTKGLTDFSVFGNAKETSISKGIESLLRGANFTGDGKIMTESNDSMSTFTLKDLEGVTFE